MPFMPEEVKNKKENNKGKTSVPLEKETKPSNKNIDTIAGIPEVDLLKEKDSASAQEILDNKKQPKNQPESGPEMIGQPLFSWQAPEFIHYEKSVLWYLTVIIIALLVIIASIYFKQWILILVIVMFAIVLIQYARRKPKVKDYSIYDNAVKAAGKIYPFKQLKSFWFIESKDELSLNFEPLKKLSPVITMPLSDIKISDLKSILTKYLPEQKRTEGLIDRTSKRLKF